MEAIRGNRNFQLTLSTKYPLHHFHLQNLERSRYESCLSM